MSGCSGSYSRSKEQTGCRLSVSLIAGMFSDTTRSSGPESPNRTSRTGLSIIFIVQAFRDEARDLADGGSDHCAAGLTGRLKLAMQGPKGPPVTQTIAVSVSVSL